jgi:hypothetical protein
LAKLPLELRPIIAALWTQPKFFDAIVGQAEALPQSAAQVAATGDYGDIPLVVLSANSSSPSRMKEHESLAHLSSQGKHVAASKGVHWIQLDEPDLVIESIREVVESVGRRTPQSTETHHDCWTGTDATAVTFGDFGERSCEKRSFSRRKDVSGKSITQSRNQDDAGYRGLGSIWNSFLTNHTHSKCYSFRWTNACRSEPRNSWPAVSKRLTA